MTLNIQTADEFYEKLPRKTLGQTIAVNGERNIDTNKYSDKLSLFDYDQLSWYKYENLSSEAVYNTFSYLFYKFKTGTFVSFYKDELDSFIPFSNENYINEFWKFIKVNYNNYSNVQQLIDQTVKLNNSKPVKVLPLNEWVADNSIITYSTYTSDETTNFIYNNLMKTLSKNAFVPDVEFYLNTNKFPLLKLDGTEPYNHLYGSTIIPLKSHNYDQYVPILSCCKTFGFADLLIPTYKDWDRVRYQRTKLFFRKKYPKIKLIDWDSKLPIAIFRGSSSGSGTTIETNQRLKAFQIAKSNYNEGRLDVGITKWNIKPGKYQHSHYLEFIDRKTYPTSDKLTLQEKSRYKYILNLEGNVASFKLSFELSSGSTILLAQSKWSLWFNKFIKPYVHYVPIKEDLSDLLDQIDWCKNNDDKCKLIATNAKLFYDNELNYDSVLNYIQKLLYDISFTCGQYAYLPDLFNLSIKSEQLWLDGIYDSVLNEKYEFPLFEGPRCIGRLNAILTVFQTKSLSDLVFVKKISDKLDCFKINTSFGIVQKATNNNVKQLEYDHEAYIGLNSINVLVSKCPNFSYIFGRLNDTSKNIYVEYIAGSTFSQWLTSKDYNFKDYVSILVQLNLALTVGQTNCAFMHNYLYPKNIIIQQFNDPISFDYIIGTNKCVRYSSKIIPIIINFGKARTVVYEKDFGLIDHGFIDLYRSNKILDTITILFSSIKIIQDKLSNQDKNYLLHFAQLVGISSDLYNKEYFRYELNNLDPVAFSPMDFVDYIMQNLKDDRLIYFQGLPDEKMARGNKYLELMTMKTGDRTNAVLETILKINRMTVPIYTNPIMKLFNDNVLKRKLSDLDTTISKITDVSIKQKYKKLELYVLNYPQPKMETDVITLDFPNQEYLSISKYMSPEVLAGYSNEAQQSIYDWITVWTVCLEGAIFNQKLDIFNIFQSDAFTFFDVISSNNTTLKIINQLTHT